MELSSPAPALAEAESGPSDVTELSPEADPRLAGLPAHLLPLRVLGQGGSSIVYEALHKRLKVKVALKLLTIDGAYAQQARTRMAREAELYALLDDPRIPRVYDVNELPDGTPYVVMEMVPGESLEDLILRRGSLPAEHALGIAREVLLALASVHERGVLHRDVKPANVILTLSNDGPAQVRLVDFGIAKMSTRGSGEEAVTQRGALVGTPHYMAPERLAGHPADASTDVYAVGIMLYEMLAGVVPFNGSSLPLVMAAVMRETPLSLAERGISVSSALSALVMKAMAREPSDRFASARDMLDALEALEARAGLGQGERVSLPTEFELRSIRTRRGLGTWIGAAALLSGLLIALGFALTSGAPHGPGVIAAQPAQAASTAAPVAEGAPKSVPMALPRADAHAAENASSRASARKGRAVSEDARLATRRHRTRASEEPDEEPQYWDPEVEVQREAPAVRGHDLRAEDFVDDQSAILPQNPY